MEFSNVFWPLMMGLAVVNVTRGFAKERRGQIFGGTVWFLRRPDPTGRVDVAARYEILHRWLAPLGLLVAVLALVLVLMGKT